MFLLVSGLTGGCVSGIAGRPVAGSAPPVVTTTVPIAVAPVEAKGLTGVCALLIGDNVAGVVDSKAAVIAEEQPRQVSSSGLITYDCRYRTQGESQTFGALTVVFAPGRGGLEMAGFEGATRSKVDVKPVDGVGDLAATYAERDSDRKRGITAIKRLGADSVGMFFSVNTPIPDVVTSRLPAVALAVMTRLV